MLFICVRFYNQIYICSKHTAQVVCDLMPVKYAPAHTNWVGASTYGRNAACFQTSPWNERGTVEVCPISSQQPTREGGREGGMAIQRKREKTSYSLMLHLTFAFLSNWTSHFPWNFSDVVTAGLLLFIKILGFFQRILKPFGIPLEML